MNISKLCQILNFIYNYTSNINIHYKILDNLKKFMLLFVFTVSSLSLLVRGDYLWSIVYWLIHFYNYRHLYTHMYMYTHIFSFHVNDRSVSFYNLLFFICFWDLPMLLLYWKKKNCSPHLFIFLNNILVKTSAHALPVIYWIILLSEY